MTEHPEKSVTKSVTLTPLRHTVTSQPSHAVTNVTISRKHLKINFKKCDGKNGIL